MKRAMDPQQGQREKEELDGSEEGTEQEVENEGRRVVKGILKKDRAPLTVGLSWGGKHSWGWGNRDPHAHLLFHSPIQLPL